MNKISLDFEFPDPCMSFDVSFYEPPKELNISRCQQSHCETCGNCESRGQWTRRCGNCLCVYYCTESCQRKHWRTDHKTMCRHIKKHNIDITNALRDTEEDPSDDDAEGDAPPGLPPPTPPASMYRFNETKIRTIPNLSPKRRNSGLSNARLPELLPSQPTRLNPRVKTSARSSFTVGDFSCGGSAAPISVLAMPNARAARAEAQLSMGSPAQQSGSSMLTPTRQTVQKTEELPSLFQNGGRNSFESPSRNIKVRSKRHRYHQESGVAENPKASKNTYASKTSRYSGRGKDSKITHAATARKIHAMMAANSEMGENHDRRSCAPNGERLTRARHRLK